MSDQEDDETYQKLENLLNVIPNITYELGLMENTHAIFSSDLEQTINHLKTLVDQDNELELFEITY